MSITLHVLRLILPLTKAEFPESDLVAAVTDIVAKRWLVRYVVVCCQEQYM